MFIAILFVVVLISAFAFAAIRFTGYIFQGPGPGSGLIGPTAEEQACMRSCVSVGCTLGDMTCMQANGGKCQVQCNVKKPDSTGEGVSCMEGCVVKGCGEFDFSCQEKNKAVCEKECGMIKEPEAKSEEEQCIRDCVNAEEPGLICRAGEGGEQGNEICQSCAKSCESLYEGPCLTEIKLEEKKSSCNTCEKCYGAPVMGDSGEGYACIVDVSCKDASAEFGDEPGTGPGVGQEGFVASVGEGIGNVLESIGNFFKGVFGGEDKSENTVVAESP